MEARRSFLTCCVVLAAIALAACSPATGSRETSGTIAGAAIGGIIGSQFGGNAGSRVAAGLVGAAIGGFIGNRIGAYLDEQEAQRLAEITRQTMTTGSTRSFTARSSGARVSTQATGTRVSALGDTCRTVEQRAVLRSGEVVVNSVEACRDRATGAWNI